MGARAAFCVPVQPAWRGARDRERAIPRTDDGALEIDAGVVAALEQRSRQRLLIGDGDPAAIAVSDRPR
jgi:hypothetical protein